MCESGELDSSERSSQERNEEKCLLHSWFSKFVDSVNKFYRGNGYNLLFISLTDKVTFKILQHPGIRKYKERAKTNSHRHFMYVKKFSLYRSTRLYHLLNDKVLKLTK